jgi:hypothetical protein
MANASSFREHCLYTLSHPPLRLSDRGFSLASSITLSALSPNETL